MKLIIAGSRSITDYDTVQPEFDRALDDMNWTPDLIVSGGAPGIDTLGERYGKENEIYIQIFPAKWDEYGKAAGPQRNAQMVEYADKLLAIWDGKSPGTKDIIQKAHTSDMPIWLYNAKTNDYRRNRSP
jgi:hypothetical protein